MSYGTETEPIFVKDGQYLTFTASGSIVLGNVVKFATAGEVEKSLSSSSCIGVAVSANRFSRTMTDDTISDGEKVTVCTRGVVNVYTDNNSVSIARTDSLGG